jgi:hypothetical protein
MVRAAWHGLQYILRGKPVQNVFIERLNRTYREKVSTPISLTSRRKRKCSPTRGSSITKSADPMTRWVGSRRSPFCRASYPRRSFRMRGPLDGGAYRGVRAYVHFRAINC